MVKASKTFLGRARSWTKKQGLHGPGAFLRFVMMTFVERLNAESGDFVFKGGNLLWVYIKTPRSTVDLDFSTKQIASHEAVEEALKRVCLTEQDGVTFNLKAFSPVERPDGKGAAVRIGYQTNEGQSNQFEVDIVYALPALTISIPSPISDGVEIVAVTVENIIADKLSAAHRFKSGNTRMKDFDDLWRISKADSTHIVWQVLSELLKERVIVPGLDLAWISVEMDLAWAAHLAANAGLPASLRTLMNEVNNWWKGGLNVS